MQKSKKTLFPWVISALVLILVSVPYFLADRAGGRDFVFSGFLFNPLDGHSYLAKILQGWEGKWRFTLPFTAEPGKGAYLFLYYLFLGHVARFFNLPILWVFHGSRLIGAAFLLGTLWRFYGAFFQDPRPRKFAFSLSALGSGLGWLFIPVWQLTNPDFWVPEIYPFYSSFVNSHFTLGLALVLWLVMPPYDHKIIWQRILSTSILALALSVINPFGIVIALMVLGGTFAWLWIRKNWLQGLFVRGMLVSFFGLPMLVYDFWVVATDPIFGVWDAQNQVSTPPPLRVLISLSPAILAALIGVFFYFRSKHRDPADNLARFAPLMVWVILGLILLYIPVSIQRRFMMGLHVPLAGLAASGVVWISRKSNARYRFLATIVFLLALPSNLILFTLAGYGVIQRDPGYYLTASEARALSWLDQHSASDSLVLSSPEMGVYIPSYTRRRVIYGHPYETVHSEDEKAAVQVFFSGELSPENQQDFIANRGVDYVFYGPREQLLGGIAIPDSWTVVFKEQDVTLYHVDD